MEYLNERDIENLKRIHPKKTYIRYIFLAIGLIIILLGFVFLLIGYDFKITFSGINLSLFINIVIMLFGGIIVSKFFIAPYYLRENSIVFKKIEDLREPVEKFIKFTSVTFSRLIASLILIISGIISLLVFGTDVGHEVKYGSAISLGGPSWFYVTGLPVLGIGFGLLLYFFLSPFRGVFSKSKNFLFFYELRPGFPWLTEIPKKDIEGIRYQNNHLGPKLSWIILLIPFIAQQLMTAIPLFSAERAGPSYVLSWTFLIISIFEIIALILLVVYPQNYFEIATKERLYEMWFSPIKFKNQSKFKEDFSIFLECNPEIRESELQTNNNPFSDVNDYHFQLLKVVFGIFLVISAILMLTQMILFGPLVWWISLMYGLILIIKASFFDFSKKGGISLEINEDLNTIKFRKLSKSKFHYIMGRKIEALSVRKWFRKLDFFDIFGISGMLIFLTIQQTQGWVIADTISLISDNIISTIYMIIVILFILFYLCFPVDVIEFKTQSIKYHIEITLKPNLKEITQSTGNKGSKLSRYFSNFKNIIREIFNSNMKTTFLMRVIFIGALIIGSLLYMLIYFIVVY
jgi:hypothetical protein